MTKCYRFLGWLAFAGLLFTGNVLAGGLHYKINTSTNFYADQAGNLAGVRVNWVYDPEISAFILEGREISDAGLKQLADDILGDLYDLDYFAELSVNGEPVKFNKASQPSIKLTDAKGIQLGFQLPLPEALPVSGKTFGLTFSDPDATADMNYSGVERIVLAEALADRCGKPDLVSQAVDTGEHELTIHSVVVPCP